MDILQRCNVVTFSQLGDKVMRDETDRCEWMNIFNIVYFRGLASLAITFVLIHFLLSRQKRITTCQHVASTMSWLENDEFHSHLTYLPVTSIALSQSFFTPHSFYLTSRLRITLSSCGRVGSKYFLGGKRPLN